MPAFGPNQQDEVTVWDLGWKSAENAGNFSSKSKQHDGKPGAATAFVAGFMGGAFIGKLPRWITKALEPEVLGWIEEGYASSKSLEGLYIGKPYEANTAGEIVQAEPKREKVEGEGYSFTIEIRTWEGPEPDQYVEMITGPIEHETWRPIIYYPGGFVSNLGQVRDWKGIRRPYLSGSHDHPKVAIPYGGSKFVHRVVAETWLGPRPKGLVICHFNDNKLDARLANLRYDTTLGNAKDRVRNRKLRLRKANDQRKS